MHNAVQILRALLIAVIGAIAVAATGTTEFLRGACTTRMTTPSDGGACACSTQTCLLTGEALCAAADGTFYENYTSCLGVRIDAGPLEDGCCTFEQYMDDNAAARERASEADRKLRAILDAIHEIVYKLVPVVVLYLLIRHCAG